MRIYLTRRPTDSISALGVSSFMYENNTLVLSDTCLGEYSTSVSEITAIKGSLVHLHKTSGAIESRFRSIEENNRSDVI